MKIKQCTKCHTMKNIVGEVCKRCESFDNIKQIHKEFDERFPNPLEEVITDSGYEVNKKLKDFIDQSIDKAIAEERERIVKEITVELEKISNEPHVDDSWHRGEIDAYINILNKI